MRKSLASLALITISTICYADVDLVYDGLIIDRVDRWDTYPTHLYIDGVHHIWFCSNPSDPNTGGNGTSDAIFHSTSTQLGPGSWSTPVEVLDKASVPFADSHVCDPTVILGTFSHNATSYSHTLYFTFDDASSPIGVNNAVGAAFSNDGVTWTVLPEPIIGTEQPPDGTYGAGASSVAWGPEVGVIQQVFRDTTADSNFWGRHRRKTSTDGIAFGPTPGHATLLTEQGHLNATGREADIAYNPVDSRWYAALSTTSFSPDFFAVRILRSVTEGLDGEWTLLGEVGESLTGEITHNNPALARNANSTLFVDANGWGYMFLGTGPQIGEQEWWLGQVRFRVFEATSPTIYDSFRTIGQNREPGDALSTTNPEIGGRQWTADPELIFSSEDSIVPEIETTKLVATIPFDFVSSSTSEVSVEANIDLDGADWIAVGFSQQAGDGLFAGELWVLMNRLTERLEIFADGINHSVASIDLTPIPLEDSRLQLAYNSIDNETYVSVDGVRFPEKGGFSLDPFSFTPTILHAGFHLLEPTTIGPPKIRNFFVNRIDDIFRDGFESGDTSFWSCSTNGICR